ncbi:YT521-B-like domain-containing protein [Apodospora peruviana]|uniref:YT521-B-like domain-containing protein n=1 Tax=Apodospora peruviana TaxID=516989 RepID=A0AAE0MFF7_9PEZI|nr:YT521-B-like domain-containing protein [Apodospora peruviana]
MGDTPLQPGAQGEFPRHDLAPDPFMVSSNPGTGQVPAGNPPVLPPSHLLRPQHHHHHQQQQYSNPQHAFSSQLDMAQPHSPPRAGPFDLSAMTNALPQASYRTGPYGRGQPRYNPMAVPLPAMAAQGPTAPYAAQNAMGMVPNQQYYLPQHHMAQYYANAVVVGQQPHPAAQYYYPQTAHFPAQPPAGQPQMMPSQYMASEMHQNDPRLSPPQLGGQPANIAYSTEQNGADGRQNIVRGPPRKPRQSGHAIWIGNLPPQTDLMSLVHHVCKEAAGLESLFLISKSNCAFANFKDEEACVAAQRKLHDSKFQTVRLVSRLRKSTVEGAAGVTAPTGPAASTPPAGTTQEPEGAWEGEAGDDGTGASIVDESRASASPTEGGPQQKDRFFILKSLTVEDLELSVRTGIWATQSHNEEALNSAFANADNVYLVFSANKSGEYFGYARMTSAIDDNPAVAIEFAPAVPASSEVELPKAIPTEATEFAPKGRIIDDSARGTIFWEVERDDRGSGSGSNDDEGPGGGSLGGDSGSVRSGDEGAGTESKAWGKPFRLKWLSTARLPFYRTRGLRNPWNSNREVKIARDGTELQPAVGRRLIGLFNRVQSPALGSGIQGPVVPTAGFPPMRQTYQPQ